MLALTINAVPGKLLDASANDPVVVETKLLPVEFVVAGFVTNATLPTTTVEPE